MLIFNASNTSDTFSVAATLGPVHKDENNQKFLRNDGLIALPSLHIWK